MPQSFSASPAPSLGSLLAKVHAGEGTHRSDLFELLREVPIPASASLLPQLKDVLTLDDPQLKYYAARALGSLGVDALPAIPELVKAAEDDHLDYSVAAIQALGCIPSTRAIECLVGLLERCDIVTAETVVAPALLNHGSSVGPCLSRVMAAAHRLEGDDLVLLRDSISGIHKAVVSQQNQDLVGISFPVRVPIWPLENDEDATSSALMNYRQILPDGVGLVYDGKFRFDVKSADPYPEGGLGGSIEEGGTFDIASEVGLAIYRLDTAGQRCLSVITSDDLSYGINASTVICQLATAIAHVFALDAESSIWVMRTTTDGGARGLPTETVSVVKMSHDSDHQAFHSPVTVLQDSMRQIFAQVGLKELP